ncbi:MAG: biotin attachment protein [Chloroflexi bacterium]|jgi:biotin carboxyl carrier protein|nr:biotin attachment protein [Chloroflexota bacterium]MBT4003640.1 biotin attachment protein [Chloroflexota bacterium]MBT4305846.1 biotin attachment protein [Chloroflexota bacterium]MBT4533670.1 biotin attachment protein [Chloroflexota bacterium]MBT4681687.1 biotin attachment protein [Chloroflexota bacterium]
MKYITTVNGVEYEVEILDRNKVRVNETIYEVDFETVSGQNIYTLLVDGRSFEAHVAEDDDLWNVLLLGDLYKAEVVDEREKRLREAAGIIVSGSGEYVLKSPMPGMVVKIPVTIGQEVETGDVLVILESMKMQNELKSPQDGIISEIRINEGENVEQKESMIVVRPKEE